MSNNALIGYTGFVGSSLRKQGFFESMYRSTNISEISGKLFDLVVCAGAPAQKWIANRDPVEDRKKIEGLIMHLKSIQSNTFVLISSVDVFKSPVGVNEETDIDIDGLHAYGTHRRMLEEFVEQHFSNHLIIRLPGLVGPGLRKNIIFDFLNDNNLHTIDSRGVFQFYPMVNLWYDIQTALKENLKLVHLTAEPISVATVAADGFGKPFNQELSVGVASYDMRSNYAKVLGGSGLYQYSKRETIQAIRAYAQSEIVTLKKAEKVTT